ncbi:MAG: Holliday junction resolvase RecU [Bacilli bacterium]|nr:Holliday junction resolvase RecU [Bacilli bacterium]
MIKYPNGEVYDPIKLKRERKRTYKCDNASNRGMSLEKDISLSCDYYNSRNVTCIYKRPTPIKVVRMDKIDKAKIVEGYFSMKSTTDYNGIYRGKYMDFEAKETESKTSFSFKNIRSQQLSHLRKVHALGGIAFFVIRFKQYQETYLVDAMTLLDYMDLNIRKSFPYSFIKENGVLIEEAYCPRLKLTAAIDQMYFKD